MSDSLKPNRKYGHLFAILRYEVDADASWPIESRITVKKVVMDADHAAQEAKRLNELNQDKGAYYFVQITRLEEAPVGAVPMNGLGVESVPLPQEQAMRE